VVYLPLLLVAPFVVMEFVPRWRIELSAFAFVLPAFVTLLAGGMKEFALLALGTDAERKGWRTATLYLLAGLFILLTFPGLCAVLSPVPPDARNAARTRQERPAVSNAARHF